MTIRILEPTQSAEVLPATLAKRRQPGRPLVLGLLSNTKPNSDRILQLVVEDLHRQLPIDRCIEAAKESSAGNAAPALLDRLAEECDAVITAIGD